MLTIFNSYKGYIRLFQPLYLGPISIAISDSQKELTPEEILSHISKQAKKDCYILDSIPEINHGINMKSKEFKNRLEKAKRNSLHDNNHINSNSNSNGSNTGIRINGYQY